MINCYDFIICTPIFPYIYTHVDLVLLPWYSPPFFSLYCCMLSTAIEFLCKICSIVCVKKSIQIFWIVYIHGRITLWNSSISSDFYIFATSCLDLLCWPIENSVMWFLQWSDRKIWLNFTADHIFRNL